MEEKIKQFDEYKRKADRKTLDNNHMGTCCRGMRDGVCGYNAGDAMIVCAGSVIAVIWVNN